VPHLKAEHMAAPTNAANVKKALANSEPSTHGTSRPFGPVPKTVALGCTADNRPRLACFALYQCLIWPFRLFFKNY
jgi:hypothetical protein